MQHQAGQEGLLRQEGGPAGRLGGLWAGDGVPWAQGDSTPQPEGAGTVVSPILQMRKLTRKRPHRSKVRSLRSEPRQPGLRAHPLAEHIRGFYPEPWSPHWAPIPTRQGGSRWLAASSCSLASGSRNRVICPPAPERFSGAPTPLPLGGGPGDEGQAAVHRGVLREVALRLQGGPKGDRSP